jgi:protein-L-isoaspartate(D-aspartate) O-methyltransferase
MKYKFASGKHLDWVMGINDTYRHKGLRLKLIQELAQKGITDESVLNAMAKVPRHLFMESSFITFAYRDQAFPIGAGQTISQPYTVAFQTQLLQVKKHDKVLEVGTGSGYQTAVLLEMGAYVYTIERQRELFVSAQKMLDRLGYKPHLFFGDGYEGQTAFAPYDRIIVTAAAPEVPGKLLQQLKPGGRLVIPVGESNGQNMLLVEKTGEDSYKKTEHGAFVFVPMLKGKNF